MADLTLSTTTDGVMTARKGRRVVAVVQVKGRTRAETIDRLYWELVTVGMSMSHETVERLVDDARRAQHRL